MSGRRFILLDRDGTLIVERNYLANPDGVELIPGTLDGLGALSSAGFGLVLVTNQSGIARGYFDLATLDRIHARLTELLAAGGVRLDGIYFCPHAPDDDCACRKPRSGLVERAVADHGFDPRDSIVVGDNVGDVELGRRLGATTILVETGHGAQVVAAGAARANYVVPDLKRAAELILRPGNHAVG